MEKIDLGSEEKYSWARASEADMRSEGIRQRTFAARLPALRDGDSLMKITQHEFKTVIHIEKGINRVCRLT